MSYGQNHGSKYLELFPAMKLVFCIDESVNNSATKSGFDGVMMSMITPENWS